MTEVELNIKIRKKGKLVINGEGALLLGIIAQTNSLLAASKVIGISYNKAWNILTSINNAVESPVVMKLRGGKGGGGAIITEFGKFILNEYRMIEQEVEKFKLKLNTEINL